MRYGLVLWVIGLFAAVVRADPIRYDQIPADVESYLHFDVDRGLASRLSQIQFNGVDSLRKNMESPEFKKLFGGPIASGTCFSLGKESSPVLLLHASAQAFHQHVEVPNSTDAVVFEYDRQEVHYSSTCLLPGLFGNGGEKAASDNDADAKSQLSIGLGVEGKHSRFRGAFYTAYVGQDLIVMTLDLPAMAETLDVLNSKKSSLAKEDPHGLKAPAPPGVMLIGAGLSAYWTGGNLAGDDKIAGDKTSGTTRPVRVANSDFGMDLFGSFKGKARIARFDMGENEQNDFADATFSMIDPDSAEQLKNLLLGVKALVSMSQAKQKPLIDPLDVESAGNDVILHWSMPTTKLSELLREAAAPTHDSSLPTNVPATRPTH
jgi:hypothetical protein